MKVRKTSTSLEQLLQIAKTPIWDGDLISKSCTEELANVYLISRAHGFSFITAKGVEYLKHLGLIVY